MRSAMLIAVLKLLLYLSFNVIWVLKKGPQLKQAQKLSWGVYPFSWPYTSELYCHETTFSYANCNQSNNKSNKYNYIYNGCRQNRDNMQLLLHTWIEIMIPVWRNRVFIFTLLQQVTEVSGIAPFKLIECVYYIILYYIILLHYITLYIVKISDLYKLTMP